MRQGAARKVAAGQAHSMVLTEESRRVYTFGCNSSFQLGLGHQHNHSSPQLVPLDLHPFGGVSGDGLRVVDIAAGARHSLCCSCQPWRPGLSFAGADGGRGEEIRQVWAWGENACGQCGNGTTDKARAPELWGSHLCANSAIALPRVRRDALSADGLAASLAAGVPRKMAAGCSHSVIVTSDGRVWVCGSHRRGQLGLGPGGRQSVLAGEGGAVVSEVTCPLHVVALEHLSAVDVSCSENATCVVTRAVNGDRPATYRVWSFGDNARGGLGLHDSSLSREFTPREMTTLGRHEPRAVSSGGNHSVVVCAQGCAYAWGDNAVGQLGCGGRQGLVLDAPQLVGGGDDEVASPFREWHVQAAAGGEATYFLCRRGGVDLTKLSIVDRR